MAREQAAPETKGVTVELLATLDLGPEIAGMAGRQNTIHWLENRGTSPAVEVSVDIVSSR